MNSRDHFYTYDTRKGHTEGARGARTVNIDTFNPLRGIVLYWATPTGRIGIIGLYS